MSSDPVHYLYRKKRLGMQYTPNALCGNGAYYKHLKWTETKSRVTCPECLKRLGVKNGDT